MNREEIRDIDKRIVKLLSERIEIYKNILKEKNRKGRISIIDLLNEIDVFLDQYGEEESGRIIKKIYNEIINSSFSQVKPLKAAYLGPEGTFTNIALNEIFGSSVEKIPKRTIREVFYEVEEGNADYGVVPVENSTEGPVTFTLDEMIETDLNIVAEKYIRISYCLLSKGGDIGNINKVYTHPQPHGQCKSWLQKNLPGVSVVYVDSTSRAAEIAADEPNAAAIASRAAGEIYSLEIAADRIEDLRQNYTRFYAMGKTENMPCGKDKTSIVCAIKDKPGALLSLLMPFSELGINMTKIESRPNKKKMWQYNFFIDFLGHKDDSVVVEALNKMMKETVFLKVLGSYRIGI